MITNSKNPAKKKDFKLNTAPLKMWNLLKHDLKIHSKTPRQYSVVLMKLTPFYSESQTNPINI